MTTMTRRIFFAAALVAAAGCSGGGPPTSKVSGAVTLNGKPLEDGYIVFRAADGKGSEAGGPIVSGSYTLSAVPQGAKVVIISNGAAASPTSGAVLSSEEASKLRAPAPGSKAATELIDPKAKGNGAQVEVKAGAQTFDFAIKTN